MELGQAETLGIFDHHNRGVGHVDSHLHHGGGDQNLDLVFKKTLHDLIFFLRLHLAVEIFHLNKGRKPLPKSGGILDDILGLHGLALLHHGTDHIDLPSLLHLSFDEGVGFFPVGSIHDAVLDGQPVGGQLIDDGNIQIAVEDYRQGPGNRCGAHDDRMGHGPFLA